MIALPDIFARVTADLDPIGKTFSAAQSLASGAANIISGAFSSLQSWATSAASAVENAMQNIDNTAKAADRMGVSLDAFKALRLNADLAGVGMEQLEVGVKQMQNSLVDAAGGSADAAAKFSALGISAADLVNMPADEAIGKIGDALKGIENPAQRAAAAANIFGMRAGPDLLALLTAGSGGIADAKKDIEEMGLSMNRVDAAKVEAANDAITRVQAALGATAEKVAVALAPYIEMVANLFLDAAKQGNGFGDKAGAAVEWVATAVAGATDYLKLFQAGWEFLKIGVLAAADGILIAIDFVGSGLVKLLNKLPGVNLEWTNTFADMSDSLQEQIGEAMDSASQDIDDFSTGANSAKVAKFFDDAKKKSQEAADAIADDAGKMHGKFPEQQLGAMQGPAAATPDFKKAMADVDAFRQSLKTPKELMEEHAEAMKKWLDAGLITMDEFNAGLQKEVEKADKAQQIKDLPKHSEQLAGFISGNSGDAIKLQFALSRGANDDVPSKQLATAQRQEKLLQDLKDQLNFEVVS